MPPCRTGGVIRPASAIVIGGGPAGSLAALLLARGGVNVTLIEQSRFPRDKVCGECVSALGLAVMRRHNVAGSLESVGRTLTHSRLFGRHAEATVALPSPMLGISRSFMDSHLLAAAKGAGVCVLQPARAEAVDESADAASVRVRSLPDNAVTVETADVVLIADGRDALGPRRRPPSGDLGVKAHFTRVEADPNAVTLYGGVGCYGGVAPVEGGRWNVAFAVPRAAVSAVRGDLDAWWNGILAASPAAGRQFARSERVSDWLASPLPRHAARAEVGTRTVTIGAAAGAIEPIGGEGMGTALRSAELAAETILHGTTGTLLARFDELWRRRAFFCRLGSVLLSGEATGDAVAFAANPIIGRIAMMAIGK